MRAAAPRGILAAEGRLQRTNRLLASMAGTLALLAGCGDPKLEDVSTGVYSLEVQSISDGCEPARATGRFESAIVTRADGLTLWVPEGTVVPRMVPVELDEDLETRLPARPVGECEGGQLDRKVTVTGTTSDSVGVSLSDVFSGLAGCADDSPVAPSMDCRSERRLRYLRREKCPDGIVAGPEGMSFECARAAGADGGVGDGG